ncbi:peroxide stress protein YaaA [Myroides guanonis]|uniref:UPF0246 protein SAMN04487893_11643 n=1 Tax=Myroides guanonis TaxID=1150112 RepID=A0A1I3U831_9FLAO|nr:peroxide stress protein YaaA [Myroides guanonis]SFJ78769.1 hypothetical protein SAMN04487893_11643 [Myroides guanonis]
MKVLISPAKSLDYTSTVPVTEVTKPLFIKEAKTINRVLKELSPLELSSLMKISSNLSELNWKRNQDRKFADSIDVSNLRQAVYAFNGDVYAGLDVYTLSENKVRVLQDKLRILSGLYGLLKPLDAIEPYRLEMGTKIKIGSSENLYEFWKSIIVKALNKEMKEGELLVNLASNEYFSAVDKKTLKGVLVTPEFKELRNGKLKTISFFAKKARGMMVRFIIDNDIETLEGLKDFNLEGYTFSEVDSKKNNLIFTR